MALIDNSAKEVVAKIVYYGPVLAGKTTNLQSIYDTYPVEQKGPLFPLATGTGRSLVFDVLPTGLGLLHGMRMRVQLCSVDGPVSVEPTRRSLLRSADALVFVVDSQAAAMDHNITCLESLQRMLLASRPDMPLVLQYNKRDLPTSLPLDTLNLRLNPHGLPAFEAIAHKGVGVAESLRVVTRRCFKALAALDEAALSAGAPQRRPTARFPALDPARVAAGGEEGTPPQRLPTDHSMARESLSSAPDNRHLTIPAMSREAFAAAARRHDTIPATAREGPDRSEDRYATLPAQPREQFGRPPQRHDTVRAVPGGPAPTAKPAKDDEETRPLRWSTAQSLARGSLDNSPGGSPPSAQDTPVAADAPPPTTPEAKAPPPSKLEWLRTAKDAPDEPADPPAQRRK